jgi:flagellar basal-body rod protein FlgB
MNDIGLFNAIGAKIKYLGKAQEIVSQNVANADTPGYRPKQLTAVDFGAFLPQNGTSDTLQLARTSGDHLLKGGGQPGQSKETPQKMTYEVAPAGNAVILEEQLIKANDIRMQYDLMVNLYSRNMQLMRTALGSR